MTKPVLWTRLQTRWAVLSHYQCFEGFVALVLGHWPCHSGRVVPVDVQRRDRIVAGVLDPLDPGVFQAVFGEILTLLIALEFNHTLQYVASTTTVWSRRR
jgi:hypothetical protein